MQFKTFGTLYLLIFLFTDNRGYLSAQTLNLPQKLCGMHVSDSDFHSREDVTISEFPWIGIIIAKGTQSGYHPWHSLCTATLINEKYVLTTAECLQNYPLINGVRFGEFNQRNKSDCKENLQSQETGCRTYVDYGIEEKIIHPFRISWTNINDIGLVRLDNEVTYSEYIRPICLPLHERAVGTPGDSLYLSAWGWDQKVSSAEFKKKMSTTLIANDQCRNLLEDKKSLGSHQLCTVISADTSEIPCLFYSGGSLMFAYRDQWYLQGIYTGTFPCNADTPLKYTKVEKYLDWIRENMLP